MIIIKIVMLYFIQITRTDDFPSTGTLTSPCVVFRFSSFVRKSDGFCCWRKTDSD